MAFMPFEAIFAKSLAAFAGSKSLPASSGRNVPYVTPQIRSFSSPENRNLPQARGRLRVDRVGAMIGTGWLGFFAIDCTDAASLPQISRILCVRRDDSELETHNSKLRLWPLKRGQNYR